MIPLASVVGKALPICGIKEIDSAFEWVTHPESVMVGAAQQIT